MLDVNRRAHLSPISAGWYDTPGDPTSQIYGADLAAQEEAARIVAEHEPWRMAEVPVSDLGHDARAALAGGIRHLLFWC